MKVKIINYAPALIEERILGTQHNQVVPEKQIW